MATARMVTRSLFTIDIQPIFRFETIDRCCNQFARGSDAFSRACDELFMPVRQNKSAQTISGQNGRKCAAGAPMGLRPCIRPAGDGSKRAYIT